ncbi:MAG: FKBP-type peptidyl-prolyl cis-trans isomerase [Lewinella sp.]|nr:FKBP-type peptidyl-prolyl cis-trans isomerase [Lewinella sp.]
MIVGHQHIITLAYEVREGGPGGPLVERMDTHYPFKFLFGKGRLLPAFAQRISGLSERDTFEFTLPPDQAYGFVEDGNIVDVPMSVFRDSPDLHPDQLQAGTFITLTDDQGQPHNGKILSWTDARVRVDFNHALAGKTLYFRGVILHIREATVDELIRGSYIEEDGVRR